jgi:hypothetical protein
MATGEEHPLFVGSDLIIHGYENLYRIGGGP